jgi:G3E family GTPase
MTRTPALVLTGFPGVGKTTLLARWLEARPPEARWAVLHVEPGVTRIATRAGEGAARAGEVAVAELAGGCACCAADVAFRTTLARLLRQGPWDLLMVEASALGHPARVLDRLRAPPLQELLAVLPPVAVIDTRRPAPFLDAAHPAHAAALAQVELARTLVASPGSGQDEASDVASPATRADSAATLARIAACSPWPPAILPADAACPIHAPETWPLALTLHPSPVDGRMIDALRSRWWWPADQVFDRRELHQALEVLARDGLRAHGLLRMTGVFRTARAWYRWCAEGDTHRWAETSWRTDNRLEAIAMRRFDPQMVIKALQGAR